MKNNQLLFTFCLLLSMFSIVQYGNGQNLDVDDDIIIRGSTPSIELFDNAGGELRVEGLLTEFGNKIFLDSRFGDLVLRASDDNVNFGSVTFSGDDKRLGVNISQPLFPLHVRSNPSTFGSVALSELGLHILDPSNNTLSTLASLLGTFVHNNYYPHNNEQALTYRMSNYRLKGANADTVAAFVIDAGGDIGLGYEINGSPDAALHFVHKLAVGNMYKGNGVRVQNVGDNNQYWEYYVHNDQGDLFLSVNNAAGPLGKFDDVTGDYSALSDARLKNSITPLSDVLPKLTTLNPVEYYFNHDEERTEKSIGILAQELNDVFPAFVSYQKDIDQYMVNYAGISVVAVQAIKEQQAIIDAQNQKIESLEQRLAAIERAMK